MLFMHLSLSIILYYFLNKNIEANVIVKNKLNDTLIGFLSKASTFGPEIPSDGYIGQLISVDPIDACSIVKPPPQYNKYPWIALIQRHNCSFIDKILNVQAVGYGAAIVYNTESDAVISMQGDSVETVIISSLFIGKTSGSIISEYFGTNFTVVLTNYSIPGITDLLMLIPFAVIIPICLIFIIVLLSIRCLGNRLKNRRLSQSQLGRLPLEKFKKGDRYEVCAICLDEYQDGDKLRILPCSHTYHQKCIDPWLTGTKQTCPLCNKPVFTDEGEQAEVVVDERTPLVDYDDQILTDVGHTIEESISSDSDDSMLCLATKKIQSPVEIHNQQQCNILVDASTAMSYENGLFAAFVNENGEENKNDSINFRQDWFNDDSDAKGTSICFGNCNSNVPIAGHLNFVDDNRPIAASANIVLSIEHNAQRRIQNCNKKKKFKKSKDDIYPYLNMSNEYLDTNDNQSRLIAETSSSVLCEDNRENNSCRKINLARNMPSFLQSSFVETCDFNDHSIKTVHNEDQYDDKDDIPIIDI